MTSSYTRLCARYSALTAPAFRLKRVLTQYIPLLILTTVATTRLSTAQTNGPGTSPSEDPDRKQLLLSIPHAYGTSVDAVGLSPDGTRILVVRSNDAAEIWDAESGALLKKIALGHVWHSETTDKVGCTQASALDCVTAVSTANFSPDGKRFVTAAFYDNSAKLWEVETGRLISEFKHEPQSEVSNAVFNPSGNLLLTSAGDMTAKLWNTNSGMLIKTFRGHKRYVSSARFSADGKKVLTASRDGTVMIWDVGTGRRLATLQVTSKTWVNDARFNPDGSQIIATSPSGRASIWNINTEKLFLSLGDSRVNDASFSPDGTQVLTLSDDHQARGR